MKENYRYLISNHGMASYHINEKSHYIYISENLWRSLCNGSDPPTTQWKKWTRTTSITFTNNTTQTKILNPNKSKAPTHQPR